MRAWHPQTGNSLTMEGSLRTFLLLETLNHDRLHYLPDLLSTSRDVLEHQVERYAGQTEKVVEPLRTHVMEFARMLQNTQGVPLSTARVTAETQVHFESFYHYRLLENKVLTLQREYQRRNANIRLWCEDGKPSWWSVCMAWLRR